MCQSSFPEVVDRMKRESLLDRVGKVAIRNRSLLSRNASADDGMTGKGDGAEGPKEGRDACVQRPRGDSSWI